MTRAGNNLMKQAGGGAVSNLDCGAPWQEKRKEAYLQILKCSIQGSRSPPAGSGEGKMNHNYFWGLKLERTLEQEVVLWNPLIRTSA